MASTAAGAGVFEEMMRVVEACAARIRWRLRPPSNRRLLNDILFLCTGLRSVVLMDYGGTMPQLQENLCSLLHHAWQLLSNTEENDEVMELVSIQDLFSAKFPVDTSVNLPVVRPGIPKKVSAFQERTANVECVDIHIAEGTLLVAGYPITYLFCNGSAEVATQNLSKHSLHVYRVYVRRSCQSGAKQFEEELTCFSVPCEMSTKRGENSWAKSFLACMDEKLGRCNEVWASI